MSKEVYIDGGCCPNPGHMRIAIAIPDLDLNFVKDDLGYGTANRAEYLAFIYALKLIKGQKGLIIFYTDSQLIYGQMTQNWKVNKNEDLYNEAKNLFEYYDFYEDIIYYGDYGYLELKEKYEIVKVAKKFYHELILMFIYRCSL